MNNAHCYAGGRFGVLVALAGSVSGCDASMDDGSCGAQVGGSVNVAHWWGSPGGEVPTPSPTANAEERALNELTDQYLRCNPDSGLNQQKYADRATLMKQLEELPSQPSAEQMAALPDVIQLNAGETTFAFSPCSDRQSTILAPMPSDLWAPTAWSTPRDGAVGDVTQHGRRRDEGAVWLELRNQDYWGPWSGRKQGLQPWTYLEKERWIRDYVSCDGPTGRDHWLAPIAVHHVNRLYYNVALVRTLLDLGPGQDVGQEMEDLRLGEWTSQLEKWHEQFPNQVLLALPNDGEASSWALSLLAAESVRMAFTKGPTSFEEPDELTLDRAVVAKRVMDVMELLREVSQVERAPSPLSVAGAMQAVESGRAVFTVMGDWSRLDVDEAMVGMVPFPGTQNVLVYTIDGFAALNKGSASNGGATAQAVAWMRMIADRGVSGHFGRVKGALPVHLWAEKEVRPCAEKANDSGIDCMVVPALSMKGDFCDPAVALYQWLTTPTDETREHAEATLANCGAPGHELISEDQEFSDEALEPPLAGSEESAPSRDPS